MDFQVEESGDVGVLVMEGDLTIQRAGEIKTSLGKALDSVRHVKLDFGKATEVDLACLQLICSAHLTSIQRNKCLTLSTACSGPLKQAIENAGYCRCAGCTQESYQSCLWIGGGVE